MIAGPRILDHGFPKSDFHPISVREHPGRPQKIDDDENEEDEENDDEEDEDDEEPAVISEPDEC
jgi:hypothetical protein